MYPSLLLQKPIAIEIESERVKGNGMLERPGNMRSIEAMKKGIEEFLSHCL